MSAGAKGGLLVVGAYIVAVLAAILIITISLMFLVDTHRCNAMGQALLTLWGTTAAVFFASVVVVGVIAWKIIPSTAGRLVVMGVHGVLLLVTYIGIAFGLLLAFNC